MAPTSTISTSRSSSATTLTVSTAMIEAKIKHGKTGRLGQVVSERRFTNQKGRALRGVAHHPLPPMSSAIPDYITPEVKALIGAEAPPVRSQPPGGSQRDTGASTKR